MSEDTTPREVHRSFTVRIPESLYEQIGNLAQSENMFVNTKVNQLLRLGLGKDISLNAALASLLKREVVSG